MGDDHDGGGMECNNAPTRSNPRTDFDLILLNVSSNLPAVKVCAWRVS